MDGVDRLLSRMSSSLSITVGSTAASSQCEPVVTPRARQVIPIDKGGTMEPLFIPPSNVVSEAEQVLLEYLDQPLKSGASTRELVGGKDDGCSPAGGGGAAEGRVRKGAVILQADYTFSVLSLVTANVASAFELVLADGFLCNWKAQEPLREILERRHMEHKRQAKSKVASIHLLSQIILLSLLYSFLCPGCVPP